MKKLVVLVITLVLGFSWSIAVYAITSPSLGAAGTYGVLGGVYINTTVTTITGDVGYTTGPATPAIVSGGTIYGSGVPTPQARIDAASALSTLNAEDCTENLGVIVDLSTVGAHPTGIYTPGVYCSTGAMSIGTGGITLDGVGTYLFRAVGALTTVDNSIVTLANSASSCDVFWTPTAATTLGADTSFVGTIIDNANAITAGNRTTVIGRLLSLGAGRITTDTNNISSTCSTETLAPVPRAATGGWNGAIVDFTPIYPLISLTKIPSPLTLQGGPGQVTYTYTATNIGEVAMSSVGVKDNKCSPLEFISGDSNSDTLLDLDEAWVYTCTKVVSQTETNTATAYGSANNGKVWDTANATVVVGVPELPNTIIVPPLIHIIKIPNVFSLPIGGGPVTYRYIVTNPGTEPLSDVSVIDNKCTGLPGRVLGHPGDLNKNNLLESNETWSFTCQTNLRQTTTNIGTAEGHANGLTAIDFASATVVVAQPKLPSTGVGSDGGNISRTVVIVASIMGISILFYFARRKII